MSVYVSVNNASLPLGASRRTAAVGRGRVKTHGERSWRRTRLVRSLRIGLEAFEKGKATPENRVVLSFDTASADLCLTRRSAVNPVEPFVEDLPTSVPEPL